MKKVSVIVPVYRAEQYLDRCVRSILGQTLTDLELILVDDGSPDNSPELCDEWAMQDERIHVIHQENGGASSARNAGLRVAQGEYIAFVDSDDWIEQDMYRDMYQLAKRYDTDMVICAHDKHNRGNGQIEKWDRRKCLDQFFRMNGEGDTHSIWDRLIRREMLYDFSFLEGKMNEDVHACYVFASRCQKAVYTPVPYYHYQYNQQGVTNSRFTPKKLDLLEVWESLEPLVQLYTPDYMWAYEMNKKRAYFTLLSKMHFDGYDRADPVMKQIKKCLKRKVRGAYWSLLRWKMPVSRKVLLTLFCL